MSRSHRCGVIPREKIVDLALFMAVEDSDERGGNCSVFYVGIVADEEGILPV